MEAHGDGVNFESVVADTLGVGNMIQTERIWTYIVDETWLFIDMLVINISCWEVLKGIVSVCVFLELSLWLVSTILC